MPWNTGQNDGLVTNVNPYVSGMLAVSLGLKWADAIRRVCMYTKARDEHKTLYALLRGLFPVQELCGCMTALRLARRDVLGQKMPLWTLLLPAVIVHGMANVRGMKVRRRRIRSSFGHRATHEILTTAWFSIDGMATIADIQVEFCESVVGNATVAGSFLVGYSNGCRDHLCKQHQ
jgi:hypothetical protein